MDKYKIENFRKANPCAPFPNFRELTAQECEALRAKVAQKLGLSSDASPQEVLKALSARSGEVIGCVPEVGNPSLSDILRYLRPVEPRGVLINWHQFDKIDCLDIEALFGNFDDIWYPSVDDIEIFDATCTWFLMVSHDGRIELVQL